MCQWRRELRVVKEGGDGCVDERFTRSGGEAALTFLSADSSFRFSMLAVQRSETNAVTNELGLNSSQPIRRKVMWLIEPFHLDAAPGSA